MMMKTYKIVGVMVAMFAILVASAIPSYAWQPRTRIGERIQARGGILSKIMTPRASCGSSATASCAGSTAKFTVSSCGGSVASCGGRSAAAPATVVTESAPTPIYLSVPTSEPVFMSAPDCANGYCTPIRTVVGAVASSAKGSLQFAQQLAREGRMYHDRSYIGYENVASGASSPEDAVRMWMKSPPHRRNMPFITDIQCVNGFCVGR